MTLQDTINTEISGKIVAETLVSIHGEHENNRLSESSYNRWIKAVGKQPSNLKTIRF